MLKNFLDETSAKNRCIHILIVGFILLLFMTISVSQKQIGHIDEYFSYSLANSGYIGRNHPEIFEHSTLWYTQDMIRRKYDSETVKNIVKVWNEPLLFIIYAGGKKSLSKEDAQHIMMPSDEAKFNFAAVSWNQSIDVHPPLYYMLLNIVCSVFYNDGEFSPWHGLSLNLFIFFFTLPCVYCLMYIISKGNHILSILAICVFAFSCGGTVAFLRMYMLLTFFTLLYTCLILKFFEENREGKFSADSKIYAIALFLTIVLGSFSHHYFFLYMGISGMFLCLYFAFNRKKSDFLRFLKISVSSVIVSLLLFPFTVLHLFFGEHSAGDIISRYENNQIFFEILKYIGEYLDFVKRTIFGGAGNFILSFLIIGLLILYFNRKKIKEIVFPKETYLLIPTILSFLVFVAVTAKYQDERYIMNIYPIFSTLFLYLFYMIYKAFFEKIKFKPFLILILFILMANNNIKNISTYMYRDSLNRYNILQEYRDMPCVYVYDDKDYSLSSRESSFSLVKELSLYSKVDFVKDYEFNTFLSNIKNENIIVYFCSFKDEKYEANMPVIEKTLKNTSYPYKEITREKGYPVYKLDTRK
ncbi:MAG: hypothetical protein J6M62_12305 [Selenomonadaceae bacterium]|nr:hypothetical protein [Selenomonadaceae bacterium]